MKKLLIATIIISMIPIFMKGQTYSSLWKQVKEAEQKDLPQTAQQVLGQIVNKAEQEANYGHLLKAALQSSRLQCQVAPDSIRPAVEQLQQRAEQAAGNVALEAIYNCVLGYVYKNNSWLDEDHYLDISKDYFEKALAHPDVLAQTKATNYEPFMLKGIDSRYFFDDDLLSVIGYEADRFDLLRDYYVRTGNRRAALLASNMLLNEEEPGEMEPLNKSRHIQRLDSLIEEYGDMQECGEVAMSRYDYMAGQTDATVEQKWQYINLALERWGTWSRMNYLRNQQRELTTPAFNSQAKNRIIIPQKEQVVQLYDLRNITELTMRIYKVKADGTLELNPMNTESYKQLKPLLTAMPELTQTRRYMGKRPYELFKDSITIPALPVGVYMIEIESQPTTEASRQLYFVSDVRVLSQAQPKASGEKGSELRLVVVNATSGQPIKGATVTVERGYGNNRKTSTLTSDEHGECSFQEDGERGNSCRVRAYTASDKACPPCNRDGSFFFDDKEYDEQRTDIFTDRAIYRPGQTVHVAAVVYHTKGIEHKAVAGKKITISLLDANHKDIADKEATTDEYGTATTTFTLPTQGLTGSYSIRIDGSYQNFQVEEYKRPAFEVDIPQVAQNYEDGDTVVARGTVRSYAGVPVQGATVKYQVVRRTAFWWFNYSRYWNEGYIGLLHNQELMTQGETTTDDKGQFTVDMPMILPMTKHPMFYTFELTADVTDLAGETHQGVMALPLGNRKTAFTATLPEQVLNEGDTKIAFHQQNAAGIDLDAQVRYRFDNGRWMEAKTNALITIPQMKSGRHTLYALCQKDTLEQEFTVFSLDDHRPATDTRSWFYISNENRFPIDGSPVTVQAGSSDKNVHVVYTVIAGNKLLESGAVDLSNELINRKFVYRKEYGNGLLITFAWIKDGVTYTHNSTIHQPMPDMHLDMKWQTFRNRLTPGQEEEWTLTIAKPDGRPADAQLMATLYDKSLDQLRQHGWSLVPSTSLTLPITSWQCYDWNQTLQFRAEKRMQWLNETYLQFNHFDHDAYPTYFRPFNGMRMRRVAGGLPMKMISVSAKKESLTGFDEAEEVEIAVGTQTADNALQGRIAGLDIKDASGDMGSGKEQAPMQMRENLQETAFFMPQLVCDSTGVVKMKFTLPESLTTWRFLGVAHTKDMMYGQMNDEAVARKEVMIQPNMPRFIRQGDQATISARIMNMSDQEISGTAMLQLLDPATERVILEQKQQVAVADSSTIAVTFPFNPNASQLAQYSLVIARVSISTPLQSDGEQHYLPLLPNKERVTVTVPFTQIGPGTKEINLKKLIPVNDPQAKLTVEYTNNPAWLMIQALPAIGHPHDDCAICQATSLYANSIGRHILDQNPTTKHVFEQWKRELANHSSQFSTLSSQLEKDQELKDLLLNETPWVMDADNEQEQRQRLADFFDAGIIDNRLTSAVKNLMKLQNSDGSWSWWPGMKGSAYITTTVTEMLTRLNLMTGRQDETQEMLAQSFKFLGQETVKLVDEMKKEERKGHKQTFPSFQALQWLYICAIDGRELPKNVNEANNYLKNLLKNEVKNQTMYEKALSAIILRNKTYINSLKEYTVYREDMGRYYDTQRATYSWRDYKIPTQVAAIEAIKRLTPQDTVTINEMQRWLLQQKRTQAWDTPINSADAIYAFLDGNSQALAPQQKTVIAIDGKPIDTSEATAGIGYVKTAMPAANAKELTAEKTSTGTSWGAVYAQFFQPSADIADQASGISVKREIMTAGANSSLSTLHSSLKVGDKVTVRITIEADRDYDFVQVQDKRAACLEPVRQLSGYDWRGGYYCAPKDYATSYFFDLLPKGRHIIETEYYVDREGTYETGSCTAQCAYSPEFRGTTKSLTITVLSKQ